MTVARYTFQRGETFSLGLDAVTGSPSDASAIEARIRKLAAGKTELTSTTPVAETFTITTRAASGSIPAGWTLTLSATDSVNLEAGNYLADAKLTVGAEKITTEPVMLIVKEPATV